MKSARRRADGRVYRMLRGAFWVLVHLLFKVKVTGLERVPADGPFLLVVNHLGMADAPLMMVAIPRQMVVFVADKWRRTPGMSHIVNGAGGIWVARGEADLHAIKEALTTLKAGWPLGLAPEGTRSPTRALQAGRSGAAYLAGRAGVPILPVALWGTEQMMGNLRRLRRTSAQVAVGQPFRLPPGRASSAELEAQTDEIMCRLAALLPPEYRGVYAEHPRLAELLSAAGPPAPSR